MFFNWPIASNGSHPLLHLEYEMLARSKAKFCFLMNEEEKIVIGCPSLNYNFPQHIFH